MRPTAIPFFIVYCMEELMKGKTEKYLDLLALRLAEVRLSQLGFRFVPGVYPIFKRISQSIEARARIIKPELGGSL